MKYWPSVAAIAFVLACAFSAGAAAWVFFWPQVPAKVTDITVNMAYWDIMYRTPVRTRICSVMYEYDYNAHKFTSAEQVGPSNDLARRRYPKGKQVTCWVNPFQPDQSTLNPMTKFGASLVALLTASLLTFAVCSVQFGRRDAASSNTSEDQTKGVGSAGASNG
ncbi:MAG TPA: DUF3592 domain-containing protein [Candidatus Obscuribacterales bacterium]